MAFIDKFKSGLDKAKEVTSTYGEIMKEFASATKSKGNFRTKLNYIRQSLNVLEAISK